MSRNIIFVSQCASSQGMIFYDPKQGINIYVSNFDSKN